MIVSLKFKVDFSNGKSLGNDTLFDSGSTLITGKNGRGKSLNLEMISFSLFGSVALRGKAEDYNRIKACIKIVIKGIQYEIKRTKSGADVLDSKGEPLATGHKAVNSWIMDNLGYGYDVFRIAHWCAQGDIQALADMKPTERKQMVDDVAGLTQMDNLIQLVTEESKLYRKSIESAESVLIKPTPPSKPDVPTEKELTEKVSVLEGERKEYLKIQAVVNSLTELIEPKEPVKPQEHVYPDKPVRSEVDMLEVVPVNMPEVLQGADIFETVSDLNKRLITLDATRGKLDSALKERENIPKHVVDLVPEIKTISRDSLNATHEVYRQAQIKNELLNQGQVACPNCNHFHPVALEALGQYDSVDVSILNTNLISFSDYELGMRWLHLSSEIESFKTELEPYEIIVNLLADLEPVAAQIELNEHNKKRNVENKQLHLDSFNQSIVHWKNTCKQMEQTNTQLWAQYNDSLKTFNQAKERYVADIKNQEEIRNSWLQFGEDFLHEIEQDISSTNNLLQQWHTYNVQYCEYEKQQKSYELSVKHIESERTLLEDRIKAKSALVAIKAKVKTYIIPSLNTVASYLLNEMTGGEHSSVSIDDKFEVTVDGQPLRTMSGSGKDITNLAIRIGLGRILTHKVLPLMMLDEIDAAMDEERADYTWQCIQKITPSIGQVLQVSHKNLPAQHQILVN